MNHRHVARFLLVSASFLALEMSVARADEVVRAKIGGSEVAVQVVSATPDSDVRLDRTAPDKSR